MITMSPHQQWYYAWDLSHRKSVADDSKYVRALSEARVDLNPHQVEAALFAFNSPFSKGAILADETGLGKTIEAGIILSQLWAEHRRRIIIVVPASLRLQWSIELFEKFYLRSLIMDTKVYKEIKATGKNPFDQSDRIIICSYNFSAKYASEIKSTLWDLVIFDEAHKLRNVYMKDRKYANAIKATFQKDKKVLLTATPLQNNLKELYGLISVIDPEFFSSVKTFENQYNSVSTRDASKYGELKDRVQRIAHRTLRNQVREYVNYTKRIPVVQDFTMTEAELELYKRVTEYIETAVYGINPIVRPLLSITLRKILASSSYAISFTLQRILGKLKAYEKEFNEGDFSIQQDYSNLKDDYDIFEDDDVENAQGEDELLTPFPIDLSIGVLRDEIRQVEECIEIAKSIEVETKAVGLLSALRKGFEKIDSLKANHKALIFTESRRTQEYLRRYLEANGYEGRVTCFNGENNSPEVLAIYDKWLEANQGSSRVSGNPMIDRKQAIVDHFRDSAEIMIATEAGAEGINLQFCSMLVNYDMPWNPQRIEQRIGRCHRYGQKFDVVVINFVNQSNVADMRVYELLSTKFRLFDEVFGSSDDVLGAFESGVDLEKRVAQIFRECRTDAEINAGFDALQAELEDVIKNRVKQTRVSLLENFDEEVIDKLKIRQSNDNERINAYNRHLWNLTLAMLDGKISHINKNVHSFILDTSIGSDIPTGKYTLDKSDEFATQLRAGHPLGQYVIRQALKASCPFIEIDFYITGYQYRQALLEPYTGTSGYTYMYLVKAENSLDGEEVMLTTSITDDGEVLPHEFGCKLMELPSTAKNSASISDDMDNSLDHEFKESLHEYQAELKSRTDHQIEYEIEKFESWEEDQSQPLEDEIIALRREAEATHRQWRKDTNYAAKAQLLVTERDLKRKIALKMDELSRLKDEYEERVDAMAERLQKAVENKVSWDKVIAFRWNLK